MATRRDYYEILGVGRDATPGQVKSAYRKLAVRYHPDKNPGNQDAEERFKEAAAAYAVLSDAEKRRRYDQFGHEGVEGGGFAGFDPTVFGDFADILGDLFGFGGGRRARHRGTPGADLRYELALSLEEAAFGTEKTLKIPRLESCPSCSGSGSAGAAAPEPCSACGGRGQIRFTQGFFTVARTCPQCGGEGRVIRDPCRECRGAGRVERERSIQVRIPAGVDTGSRLRLAGEGEHGLRGGRTGDLFVDVLVRRHERFYRDGPHVGSDLFLSYSQLVLGATLEVDTLHGNKPLEVPAGSQPGTEIRLRGSGIESLDGRGRGDHVVRVMLEVPHPRRLDPEQIELLRQLAEHEGKQVRGERKVLERVRSFFE